MSKTLIIIKLGSCVYTRIILLLKFCQIFRQTFLHSEENSQCEQNPCAYIRSIWCSFYWLSNFTRNLTLSSVFLSQVPPKVPPGSIPTILRGRGSSMEAIALLNLDPHRASSSALTVMTKWVHPKYWTVTETRLHIGLSLSLSWCLLPE